MLECSLDTLGSFALRVDGRPVPAPSTQKARAILVYTVMHRDADVARERLLELFWPDVDPDRARDSLRTALYSIRRGLRDAGVDPDVALAATKSIVRWAPHTSVDAERFVELAGSGPDGALAEALALYRGDFLEGDYDNWTVVERERLSGVYEGALARSLAAQPQPAIASKLLERNPYEETAYTALIEGALAEGRRLAAVQLLKQCRTALAEIGAEPSPEFVRRFAHLERITPVSSQAPRLAFAGRDDSLTEFNDVLSRVKDTGGAAVVVTGEPGIGKSAFLVHAEDLARERGLRVLRIAFLMNDPRPFGSWGPLFESVVGGSFDEFVRSVRGSPVAAIASTLLAALKGPSALLADDAQYCNEEAFSLLGAFTQLASSNGHVVVIAGRPEGRSRLDAQFGEAPRHEIELGRLSVEQLRDAFAGGGFADSDTLARSLFKRSAGNPFFVESLLDAFFKSGALQRDGTRWRLVSDAIPDVALPRTLARSIESRLRSRGPRAATVAAALALEPEATADDMQPVLEMSETDVLDAIDDLLSMGVIDQPTVGPQFSFSHDLVRDQAATLLNAARRTQVHRNFAIRLVHSSVPDATLRRARHLDAAHEPMLAAEAYVEAAVGAMELNATQEALDRTGRGIETLEQLQRTAAVESTLTRLHDVRTRALRRANQFERANSSAQEAVRHARASGNADQLVRALSRVGSVQTDLGTIGGSAEVAEAAAVASTLDDDVLVAVTRGQLTFSHMWLGNEREATLVGQAAIVAAIRSGDYRMIAGAADGLQRVQAAWWHFDEALGTLAMMQEATLGSGWVMKIQVAAWVAHFYYFTGQLDKAAAELAAARAFGAGQTRVQADDADLGVSATYYLLDGFDALVSIERGDYDVALRYGSIADRHSTPQGSPHHNYAFMVPIDALLLRDQPGDVERASLLVGLMGEQYYPPWLCSHLVPNALRARVAARRRDPGAPELVRAALDEAERCAARCPSDCYRAFNRLAIAAGGIGEIELASRAIDLRDRYLEKHRAATASLATTTS